MGHKIFSFAIISLVLIGCKTKNVYSDEAKTLVLYHCNIYNANVRLNLNEESTKEMTAGKQVDCLCYVDKIQKEIKQEEYMQNFIDPSNNKEVHEKIGKIFKGCVIK